MQIGVEQLGFVGFKHYKILSLDFNSVADNTWYKIFRIDINYYTRAKIEYYPIYAEECSNQYNDMLNEQIKEKNYKKFLKGKGLGGMAIFDGTEAHRVVKINWKDLP